MEKNSKKINVTNVNRIGAPKIIAAVSLFLVIVPFIANIRLNIANGFGSLIMPIVNLGLYVFLFVVTFYDKKHPFLVILASAVFTAICLWNCITVFGSGSASADLVFSVTGIIYRISMLIIFLCILARSCIIIGKKSAHFDKSKKLFKGILIVGYFGAICGLIYIAYRGDLGEASLLLAAIALALITEQHCPEQGMFAPRRFHRWYEDKKSLTLAEVNRIDFLLKNRNLYLQYATSPDIYKMYTALEQNFEKVKKMSLSYLIALSEQSVALQQRGKNPYAVGGAMEALFGTGAGIAAAMKTAAKNEQIKQNRKQADEELWRAKRENNAVSQVLRDILEQLEKELNAVTEIKKHRLSAQKEKLKQGIELMQTDLKEAAIHFKRLDNKRLYSACKFRFILSKHSVISAIAFLLGAILTYFLPIDMRGVVWLTSVIVGGVSLEVG